MQNNSNADTFDFGGFSFSVENVQQEISNPAGRHEDNPPNIFLERSQPHDFDEVFTGGASIDSSSKETGSLDQEWPSLPKKKKRKHIEGELNGKRTKRTQVERWACEYCDDAIFSDLQEAIEHEAECRIRFQEKKDQNFAPEVHNLQTSVSANYSFLNEQPSTISFNQPPAPEVKKEMSEVMASIAKAQEFLVGRAAHTMSSIGERNQEDLATHDLATHEKTVSKYSGQKLLDSDFKSSAIDVWISTAPLMQGSVGLESIQTNINAPNQLLGGTDMSIKSHTLQEAAVSSTVLNSSTQSDSSAPHINFSNTIKSETLSVESMSSSNHLPESDGEPKWDTSKKDHSSSTVARLRGSVNLPTDFNEVNSDQSRPIKENSDTSPVYFRGMKLVRISVDPTKPLGITAVDKKTGGSGKLDEDIRDDLLDEFADPVDPIKQFEYLENNFWSVNLVKQGFEADKAGVKSGFYIYKAGRQKVTVRQDIQVTISNERQHAKKNGIPLDLLMIEPPNQQSEELSSIANVLSYQNSTLNTMNAVVGKYLSKDLANKESALVGSERTGKSVPGGSSISRVKKTARKLSTKTAARANTNLTGDTLIADKLPDSSLLFRIVIPFDEPSEIPLRLNMQEYLVLPAKEVKEVCEAKINDVFKNYIYLPPVADCYHECGNFIYCLLIRDSSVNGEESYSDDDLLSPDFTARFIQDTGGRNKMRRAVRRSISPVPDEAGSQGLNAESAVHFTDEFASKAAGPQPWMLSRRYIMNAIDRWYSVSPKGQSVISWIQPDSQDRLNALFLHYKSTIHRYLSKAKQFIGTLNAKIPQPIKDVLDSTGPETIWKLYLREFGSGEMSSPAQLLRLHKLSERMVQGLLFNHLCSSAPEELYLAVAKLNPPLPTTRGRRNEHVLFTAVEKALAKRDANGSKIFTDMLPVATDVDADEVIISLLQHFFSTRIGKLEAWEVSNPAVIREALEDLEDDYGLLTTVNRLLKIRTMASQMPQTTNSDKIVRATAKLPKFVDKTNDGRKISSAKSKGARVYAEFSNKQYYWGTIRDVNEATIDQPKSYHVDFEDGDSLDGIPEYNVYTETHFKRHFGRDPPKPLKRRKKFIAAASSDESSDSGSSPNKKALSFQRSSGSVVTNDDKEIKTSPTFVPNASSTISHDLLLKTDKSKTSTAPQKPVDPCLSFFTELLDLEGKKCGTCQMCRKSGCGRCFSCIKNKKLKNTSLGKMCCLRRVCYNIGFKERCLPAVGFPPKWNFFFEKPKHVHGRSQMDSLSGLKFISPKGRTFKFQTVTLAKDVDQTSLRAFLSHIGVIYHDSNHHFLVGKAYRHEWIDVNGVRKVIYGKILSNSFDFAEGDHNEFFTVEYNESCTIAESLSSYSCKIARIQDIASPAAFGGCLSLEWNSRKRPSQSVAKKIGKHHSVKCWCAPDARTVELIPDENGVMLPKMVLLFRGYQLTFTAKQSSIPNAGYGAFVQCTPLIESEQTNGLDFRAGELLDIGVYAPFRPEDKKVPCVFNLKNYIHCFSPEEWVFGSLDDTVEYDITDDITGDAHEIAKQFIPKYVNETVDGYPTIYAEYDPEGVVHYLFGIAYKGDFEKFNNALTDLNARLMSGEEVEIFINYGEDYEKVRRRKGYSTATGEVAMKLDDEIRKDEVDYLDEIAKYESHDVELALRYFSNSCFGTKEILNSIPRSARKRLIVVLTKLKDHAIKLARGEKADSFDASSDALLETESEDDKRRVREQMRKQSEIARNLLEQLNQSLLSCEISPNIQRSNEDQSPHTEEETPVVLEDVNLSNADQQEVLQVETEMDLEDAPAVEETVTDPDKVEDTLKSIHSISLNSTLHTGVGAKDGSRIQKVTPFPQDFREQEVELVDQAVDDAVSKNDYSGSQIMTKLATESHTHYETQGAPETKPDTCAQEQMGMYILEKTRHSDSQSMRKFATSKESNDEAKFEKEATFYQGSQEQTEAKDVNINKFASHESTQFVLEEAQLKKNIQKETIPHKQFLEQITADSNEEVPTEYDKNISAEETEDSFPKILTHPVAEKYLDVYSDQGLQGQINMDIEEEVLKESVIESVGVGISHSETVAHKPLVQPDTLADQALQEHKEMDLQHNSLFDSHNQVGTETIDTLMSNNSAQHVSQKELSIGDPEKLITKINQHSDRQAIEESEDIIMNDLENSHCSSIQGLKEVGYSIDEAQDMIHDEGKRANERNTQEKVSETSTIEITDDAVQKLDYSRLNEQTDPNNKDLPVALDGTKQIVVTVKEMGVEMAGLDGLNMKEETTAIGNLNNAESEDRNEIDQYLESSQMNKQSSCDDVNQIYHNCSQEESNVDSKNEEQGYAQPEENLEFYNSPDFHKVHNDTEHILQVSTDASQVPEMFVRQEPLELAQKELDLSNKEDFSCQVQVGLEEGLLKTRVDETTQQAKNNNPT